MSLLPGDLSALIEREMRGSGATSPPDRARLVEQLLDVVYRRVKSIPGGGGLDGFDSEERASLGRVVSEGHDHAHRMRLMELKAQGRDPRDVLGGG